MKKIITLMMVIIMTTSFSKLHAQFEDYTWMLLGYSAMWYQAGQEKTNNNGVTSDGAKQMNLSLRTGAGIVLLSGLVAGLAVNWTLDSYKYANSIEGGDEKNTYCSFAFGPFARYYFYQWKALLLYGEAMFAMGVYRQIYKYSGSTSKTIEGLLRAHMLVGMTYFISRALALDFGMGYLWNRYNNKDASQIRKTHQFMACVGLVFFLGNNAGLVNFKNY